MKHVPTAIAVAMAVLLSLSAPVAAQLTVFDPANYSQNVLTQANTLQTTLNQATQIQNQLRQIAYEVQNLKNIPNGTWGQIQGDLTALNRVVKVGQSISYTDSNLSGEFTAMYPGYSTPTNYTQAYAQWGQNSLGAMQGAFQAAGLQNQQFASEDATFAQLQSLSDGAPGSMQAVQVGNMVAIAEVQQLQKLRELQMAQLQGQFTYLAAQQQSDLSKYAALQAWFTSQQTYKSSE